MADVKTPIIGADFLAESGLLVDLQRRRLVNAATYECIGANYASDDALRVLGVASKTPSPLASVIDDFPSILTPNFSTDAPKHGVEHHVPTSGPPVFAKARRLSPEKLAALKKDFEEMEALGIV